MFNFLTVWRLSGVIALCSSPFSTSHSYCSICCMGGKCCVNMKVSRIWKLVYSLLVELFAWYSNDHSDEHFAATLVCMISNTMLVSFCDPIPNCWNCSASRFPYMVVLTWVCEFSGVLDVGDTGICDDVGQDQRSHWVWVSWLGFVDSGTDKLYYHWCIPTAPQILFCSLVLSFL